MAQPTTNEQRPISVLEKFPPYLLAGVIVMGLLLVIGLNMLPPFTLPEDTMTRIHLLRDAGLPAEALPLYEELLRDTPHDIDLNYQYIHTFFELPTTTYSETTDSTAYMPVADLENRYHDLTQSPETADLGHYGLGLIQSLQDEYTAALQQFDQVINREMPYVNNSTGYAYVQLEQDETAEPYFQQEIANDGNVAGGLNNLLDLYFRQNEAEKAAALLADPALATYISPRDERSLAFEQGHWARYFGLLLATSLGDLQLSSILGALVIGLMWVIYFWRIDIFEQEPWFMLGLALLGGVISVFLTLFLSDVVGELWPLREGLNWQTDFLFFVFQVGLVEEIAKFLPVLALVLLFKNQVNEPVDLLIYGCLVALGFATLENALYFSGYGLNIIFDRFLLSTVGHLTDAAIVCYTWATVWYIKPRPPVLRGIAVLGALLLAALIHGLYDFFLGDDVGLAIASLASIFFMAEILGNMLRNTLNFSPFFRDELSDSPRLYNYALITAVTLFTLLLTYLYNTLTFSTELANGLLLPSFWFTIVGFFLVFGTLLELANLRRGLRVPLYRGDHWQKKQEKQAAEKNKPADDSN